MNARFVTKDIHALLDYPVAAVLIAAPFLLGLGAEDPIARWLSVATGIAALLLTILTNHKTGLIRVLPYTAHLAVDGAVGAVFLAAPFLFSFTGIDAWYYWINGIAVAIVVSLHAPQPAAKHTTA